MSKQPTGDLWFSHDAGAHGNLKHLALIEKYGWGAYGRYWAIIERLRIAENNRLSLTPDFKWAALARALGLTPDEFRDFIDYAVDVTLFSTDGKFLWSDGLCERMESMNASMVARSEAGRAAAKKRWGEKKVEVAEPLAAVKAPAPEMKPPDNEFDAIVQFWESTQRTGKVSAHDKNVTIRLLYQGYGFEKLMSAMKQCATPAPYLDAVQRVLDGQPMLGNGRAQPPVASEPAKKKPDPKDDPVIAKEWNDLRTEIADRMTRFEIIPDELWERALLWSRDQFKGKLPLPAGYREYQQRMVNAIKEGEKSQ